MSSPTPVKFILGTHTVRISRQSQPAASNFGRRQVGDNTKDPGIAHFDSKKDVEALLDGFHSRGYTHIDTARDYSPNAPGASEARLGQAGAASRFTIHSKVHSGAPGSHEPSKIDLSIGQSLDALKTSAVESMFLHIPDRQTPFEDTIKAMNDTMQQGKFGRFGLSNYTAAEVQKIVEICEQKGYAKPSVYQGHYNAIVRGGEKELFPLLRKHNIAFLPIGRLMSETMSGLELTFVSVLQRVVFSRATLIPRDGGATM